MVRRDLLWIVDCPSPYNTYLLEVLAADPEINLSVYFVREAVNSHPWKRIPLDGFRWKAIRSNRLVDWSFLRIALKRGRPFLIVGGWGEPTLQLILTFAAVPFAVWTDTPRAPKRSMSLREFGRSFWLRRVLSRATYVMGTGRPALQSLAQMGSAPGKLINFPYFVDLNAFAALRRAPQHDSLVYVSSGRLEDVKGFDVSLRALALAYKGRPERFKYRIAGVGSREPELRRLAHDLGIEDSVEFLGWLEPDQLPQLYEGADVLIHPARVEPYGVSVLEAMASGLIILASDQTNAALDRIDEGIQGFLHKTGDVEGLAMHLTGMLTGSLDLEAMQIASRFRAREWPVSRAVSIVKSMMANHTQA
jgi:glycosyltransferase involved in cell wall biosynthesis